MSGSTRLQVEGFDEVHRVDCAGAVAFVAIHLTQDGRAFGGIRIREYSDENAALDDTLALAQAMSRKLVLSKMRAGGAKAVLIAPTGNREAAVRALGEFVESLGGRYQCGADMGFTEADSRIVRESTGHMVQGSLGQFSARSAFIAMSAVGDPRVVAIQGLGAVGLPLAETLRSSGCQVLAADPAGVHGFDEVSPDAICDAECDVFAPCAHGSVLDAETVARLKCSVVCGGANNALAGPEIADLLRDRGIVYVPGFVSNVGAAIKGVSDVLGESDQVGPRLLAIRELAREIVRRAEWEDTTPYHTAVALADESIARLRAAQ